MRSSSWELDGMVTVLCVEFDYRGVGFEFRHISGLFTQVRDGIVTPRCFGTGRVWLSRNRREAASELSGEEGISRRHLDGMDS